jgi:hypothetical protein
LVQLFETLSTFKAVSILTGLDTDFRKWSVEWPTNVWQRCLANL